MRSRGQSPLLPFTTSQKIPSKSRSARASTATRVLILALGTICILYGAYAGFGFLGGQQQGSDSKAGSGNSGRGLAAHDEVAQLQGKDAPVLETQTNSEVDQLQTQNNGHKQAQETLSTDGLAADEAAQALDSVHKVRRANAPPSGWYTMTAVDIDGLTVDLAKFAGKVSLVVNVASECGYTDSNYRGLQELYTKYKEAGFEILAFPCNAFGKQEPGSNQAVKDFARVRYGVTFPLFEKVEVLGPDAHPIFKFLAENLPPEGTLWQPKWNFSKWLVDKSGMPISHYDSAFDAAQLERDIAAAILKAS